MLDSPHANRGIEEISESNAQGYFQDLDWETRQRAYALLHKFCQRWGSNLPCWRLAILVGQAKRLARMSDEDRSAWGRKMLAKRGGYAVQRRYRAEGRTRKLHPAHLAARVSASKRKWKKIAEERKQLGIKPRRHSSGDLEGI